MKKSILFFVVLYAVITLASPTPMSAASKYLSITLCTQEHSQWCWSGTSQMILKFKGKNVSQCAIANYAWSRSDCCGNTTFNWNHTCNRPNSMYGATGSIQAILKYWGVNSTGTATYLSYTSCQTEINGNRPFVMRWGWSSGGGHFLNGYGYNTSSPGYLSYMDPWPGEGLKSSTYTYVKSASDHSWTHTLKTL